jgi:hypothetical protein
MHTRNAYTVLGLKEPAAPAWVPPLAHVRAAKRRFAGWHPDRYKANGLPNVAEGERIYAVIAEALGRFEEYWDQPVRARARHGEDGGLLRPVSSTVPHFSNKTWGMLELLLDATKSAFTPPYKRSKSSTSYLR